MSPKAANQKRNVGTDAATAAAATRGERMRHLLLWVPCVIALWAPLYNMTEPTLFGVPFFYWFQLLLIPVSALTIYAADRLQKA
jgi:hypothetical protein